MQEQVLKQNPILLNFKNRIIEQEFKLFYERETRLFIRAGIILSIVAWLLITFMVYIVIPERFNLVSIVISIVTYPVFIFIIYSTFKDKFLGYYQLMAAIASEIAGVLTIYVFQYFPYGEFYIALATILVNFFVFYMFRLRFILSVATSLVYLIIFQIYLLTASNLETPHVIALSLGICFTAIISFFGGYVSESTSRKIFIQQKTIKEQQEKLMLEYERSEELLLNILPQSIAQRLKEGQSVIADSFDTISVLFADIVGFTLLSERLAPEKLVTLLNQIFSAFDGLIDRFCLEKIKTIGDAYMVAGGLPVPRKGHVEDIAELALEMKQELVQFNVKNEQTFDIRIGIHIGPAVGGVIGTKKFVYDIWGDTVNTASRMESHGISGEIQVSDQTYEHLKDKYIFRERGAIDVKGKGKMETYLLQGKK